MIEDLISSVVLSLFNASLYFISVLLYIFSLIYLHHRPHPHPLLSCRKGAAWVNRQVLICHHISEGSITHVSHCEWEKGWRDRGTAWSPSAFLTLASHRRPFVRYPTYLQMCTHTHTHLSLPFGSPEIPFRPITAALFLKSPPDETLSYICTSSIEKRTRRKWAMVILVWR